MSTDSVPTPGKRSGVHLEAARTLRARVARLPVGIQATWEADGHEIYAGPDRNWVAESLHLNAPDDGESVAVYIVTMQPALALVLAQYLEDAAMLRTPSHVSFKVAHAVLGREYPGGAS